MTLGEKQRKFTLMLGRLYIYAYSIGYELSLGRGRVSLEANEADGGVDESTHLYGVGQDLNIYKDGMYLTDGTGHHELHDYWDAMGGAERIDRDLNHYSLEHNGIR